MPRLQLLLMIVIGFALVECAAEPSKGPGLCRLQCSSSIIAARDYKIEALTPDLRLRCVSGDRGETSLVTSKFLVTRKRNTGSGQGSEEVSVPNVTVQPVIRGLYATAKETTMSGDIKDEAGVLGLRTVESNLCSDTCGVVTIDYEVKCPIQGTGEAQAFVMSGGLISDVSQVTIESMTYIDDDDDSTSVSTGMQP